ncbi:FKBP-type peptidyl-prolyl cis-trans isomerase [Robertkochia aurantiaca]|uniref:FKBP-type peptidyl-prolyl cis-trans isomerase n=1 Tax=Robertkochia aurantiaca TaxID=2873700 RepID=UPI001CCB6BF4|nr:peptidylprolyl isomerase [Robertkochia sp. 3YJGBD-33]
MSEAKKGSKVKVHYTGKLTDDTVFDSSREREPIEFEVGAGQMIEGFDVAVNGMKVGESKKVTIPADKAYGPRVDEAIFTVPKTQLPEGMEPQVGMQLEARQQDGRRQILLIQEVKEEDVVLDANHPLAGKDLVFDIELVEVA